MSKVLQIKNLNFKFQYESILKDISMTVDSGDFIVILGHNGSGKSTLLKAINRQLDVEKGKMFFSGQDLLKIPKAVYSKKVVCIDQHMENNIFCDFTIAENIETMLGNDAKLYTRKLQIFNKELAAKIDMKTKYLSGGQKQMLSLFLAIQRQPQLLLLDEHTAALDPKAAKRIMRLTDTTIAENNITCLMVTHNLDDVVKYGNKLIILKEGEICLNVDKSKKKITQDFVQEYF